MRNTIEKAQERMKKSQDSNDNSDKQEVSISSDDNSPSPSESVSDDRASHNIGKPKFIIDLDRLKAKGMVSVSGERTLINEEYREIKRKLIGNSFGPISKTLNNSNIIMVSSARPSEGKTFTAVNLALSIVSEQDKTVLLVDADVLKPNVLRTLGLKGRPGLMEHLTGEVDSVSDVLYHTNIDKLKIIPSGRTNRLSTELLASKKMHDTVDEFANRYPDRIVIIDTPPIIGITESAVLTNFAGQAVVVVEENKSTMADIENAAKKLNPDMAIGFVVNKSINSEREDGDYYGYYSTDD